MKRYSASLIIREMQIKTTRFSPHIYNRMVITKKSTINKCWWGCGKKEALVHCWWECKLAQPLSLWTESLVGYSPWGRKESDTTEQLKCSVAQLVTEPQLSLFSFIAVLFLNFPSIAASWRYLPVLSSKKFIVLTFIIYFLGFLGSSAGNESTCNARDPGSTSGLWSSPGKGIGYPLQYSWAALLAHVKESACNVEDLGFSS